MTPTIISLMSIVFGIIGANGVALYARRYSLGVYGNTIAGVFGSVLLIKTLGRLGIDPLSIIQSSEIDVLLLLLNLVVSLVGGVGFVVFFKFFIIKYKVN